MLPTGIIFAALDCDADVIEDWNRWYDLEHTPPNVVLDGIMSSNRYVAPPALHAARVTAEGSPFGNGRATFLTIYTLTGDPMEAFLGMTTLREKLVDAGRMAFPDDRKIVREGDCFEALGAAVSTPTRLVFEDVPFVGHTGIVVRQRRGDRDAAIARNARLVEHPAVHGVWSLTSRSRDGLDLDVIYVEGDAASIATELREFAPTDVRTEVLVDAPFDRIEPLRYPWAQSIRESDLPRTIGG